MSDRADVEQVSGRPIAPNSARRCSARAAIVTASIVAVAMVIGFVLMPAGSAVHADDGELRPRLEAACARIPVMTTRLQAAIDRLDAPATQRGSLAWFEEAIVRAENRDRVRIADDLQRRLDRLIARRSTLDERSALLVELVDRCSELGAPA